MEHRIDALEKEHLAVRKELADLDRMLTRVLAKLDVHFNDEKKFDQTIKNIDENLDNLIIDFAKQPMIRSREIQDIVAPIWDSIRKSQADSDEFKIQAEKEHRDLKQQVKDELRKEAKSHILVAWSLIVAIVIMAGWSMKRIEESVESNKIHLDRHHENHMYLDNSTRNGVLDIHTHTEDE